MSAAPIPQQPDPIKAIRAICRTPASYFHKLLDSVNYAEILCFGLILDMTIGHGRATEWAEISDDQFVAATNDRTKEWLFAGLSRLESCGWIRTRKSETTGRREYSITDQVRGETDVKGRKIRGRCPDCKTVGTFAAEYIAVPHPFFRILGACIDHAAYVTLAVIIRHSLKWTGEKGVWAEWAELELDDFAQLTGLDKSSISKALARLSTENWKLIERFDRPGRPSAYRAIPERFGKIERRGPRLVEQPKPSKTKRVASKAPTQGNESVSHSTPVVSLGCGFCYHCHHFVTPEEVAEEEMPASVEARPPRAGPGRAKKSKFDLLAEKLRARFA